MEWKLCHVPNLMCIGFPLLSQHTFPLRYPFQFRIHFPSSDLSFGSLISFSGNLVSNDKTIPTAKTRIERKKHHKKSSICRGLCVWKLILTRQHFVDVINTLLCTSLIILCIFYILHFNGIYFFSTTTPLHFSSVEITQKTESKIRQ